MILREKLAELLAEYQSIWGLQVPGADVEISVNASQHKCASEIAQLAKQMEKAIHVYGHLSGVLMLASVCRCVLY